MLYHRHSLETTKWTVPDSSGSEIAIQLTAGYGEVFSGQPSMSRCKLRAGRSIEEVVDVTAGGLGNGRGATEPSKLERVASAAAFARDLNLPAR